MKVISDYVLLVCDGMEFSRWVEETAASMLCPEDRVSRFLQNIGAINQTTMCHIPEGSNLNTCCHQNLKCHKGITVGGSI
jgi:hypothetical protein